MGNNWSTEAKDGETKPSPKVIMLGPGESGKSTILKAFVNTISFDWSNEQRQHFKGAITQGIMNSCKAIIKEFHEELIQNLECTLVEKMEKLRELPDEVKLTTGIVDSIAELWSDVRFQSSLYKLKGCVNHDSIAYFFDHIQRIASDGYAPSDEDVVRCRIRTTGLIKMECIFDKYKFDLYDTGGQRNERRKWIHVMERVSVLVYVTAIGDYDAVCYEDSETNRIRESVECFAEVSNCSFLMDVPIVLVFTKADVFEKKFAKEDISKYLPEFRGHTVQTARDLMVDLHLRKVKNLQRDISVHFVNFIDPGKSKTFFVDVRDHFLNPDPPGIQTFRRATWLKRVQRYEESLQLLEKVLALEPSMAVAHNEKGEILTILGRLSEAQDSIDTAIKMSPAFVDAYSNKAAALNAQRRFKEAAQFCNKVLKANPKQSKAHDILGQALFHLGQPEEALKEAETATKLDPLCISSYRTKLQVMMLLQRSIDALMVCQECLELEPMAADLYQMQARILLSLGKNVQALEAGSKAVSLDPKFPGGFAVKGEAHYCMEQFDDARKSLETIETLSTMDECSQKMKLWYHYQIALQLFQDGAYDECLKKLSADLRIQSQYPLFWDLRFKCLLHKEDFKQLWNCGAYLKAYTSSNSMMEGISQTEKRMMVKTVKRYLQLKRGKFGF
jgi:guanine nucleotide-binding protein G(i) subunit alpha